MGVRRKFEVVVNIAKNQKGSILRKFERNNNKFRIIRSCNTERFENGWIRVSEVKLQTIGELST